MKKAKKLSSIIIPTICHHHSVANKIIKNQSKIKKSNRIEKTNENASAAPGLQTTASHFYPYTTRIYYYLLLLLLHFFNLQLYEYYRYYNNHHQLPPPTTTTTTITITRTSTCHQFINSWCELRVKSTHRFKQLQ